MRGDTPVGWARNAIDWLWGYDFFVSYAHADSSKDEHGKWRNTYATFLAEALRARRFSVFLDESDYDAGEELKSATLRRVRSSRKLLLIARPFAMKSDWVFREVETALSVGTEIVVIDINHTYDATPSANPLKAVIGADRLRVLELLSDIDSKPSKSLLDAIERGGTRARRDKRRLIAVSAAALLFTTIAIVATWQWERADTSRRSAIAQRTEAHLALAETNRQRNRWEDQLYWYARAAGEGLEDDPRTHDATDLLASWSSQLVATVIHDKDIVSLAFIADGSIFATASADRTVRLWQADSGKPYSEPLRHEDAVTSLAFSSDGTTLGTGSADGKLSFWSIKPVVQLKSRITCNTGSIAALAFHPSGSTIAVATGDNTIRFWNVTTGISTGPSITTDGDIRTMMFSPDGEALLTGTGKLVKFPHVPELPKGDARLWDAKTGKALGDAIKHNGFVNSVAFSPNGSKFATATGVVARITSDVTATGLKTSSVAGARGEVQVWKRENMQPDGQTILHGAAVNAVAFSPDGTIIVTGSDDMNARFWDVGTAVEIGVPLRQSSAVTALAFSPDGTTVGTAGADQTARLWHTSPGKKVGNPIQHGPGIVLVEFSPNDAHILTVSEDGSAQLWNAVTGTPLGRPLKHDKSNINAATFSPDGKRIVTGARDGTSIIWNANTGAEVHRLPLHDSGASVHDSNISVIIFSPDGETFIVGGGRHVTFWRRASDSKSSDDASTYEKKGTIDLRDKGTKMAESVVSAAAFSPDGSTLVTGSRDNSVRFWSSSSQVDQGSLPSEGERGTENIVTGLCVSPDGRNLVVVRNRTHAQVWDFWTRTKRGEGVEHTGLLRSVGCSPSGSSFATGDVSLKGPIPLSYARRWSIDLSVPIGAPIEHRGGVVGLSFSQSGRFLITGTESATNYLPSGMKAVRGPAQIWEIPPPSCRDDRQLLLSLEVRTGFEWDSLSGNKHRLSQHEWLTRQNELTSRGGPCDVRPWQGLNGDERASMKAPMRPFIASPVLRSIRYVADVIQNNRH